jgi:hypothetical protein
MVPQRTVGAPNREPEIINETFACASACAAYALPSWSLAQAPGGKIARKILFLTAL